MSLSPDAQKIFNMLVSEMMEDGFVRISENTYYKKLGGITVSLMDNALNIAHKGKLYGIIPEREILKLANGVEPVLFRIKYLLAAAMQQDMNRFMNMFYNYFLN